MEPVALRAHFPVLERLAYLNAGTDGPLPAVAVQAAQRVLDEEAHEGRAKAHFERRTELGEALRALYASALRCEASAVALSTCTTEGLSIVLDGMGLREGDEILTSDEEHPGLLGALAVARALHGAEIRVVPFDRVAAEVGPRTRLVACSHVSWMTGRLAPAELADVEPPVLLDGAQGVGAVDVDVAALGCDAYAGAGQKWLCGPDGLGMLYLSSAFAEQLASRRRGYGNMVDPDAGLDARLHSDARRFDTLSVNAETVACGLAAGELLCEAGWDAVSGRAADLADRLAEMLAQAGRSVVERSRSTLVSFSSDDPAGERAELAELGIVLRDIPGRPWLRASVGAWNDDSDIERLLDALTRPR